ncbi:hypothetical protein FKM82_023723 [Ascaphus truei]
MGLAQANLRADQIRQKRWYDRNAHNPEFIPWQQILVLKPTCQNKLLAAWSCPYKVIRRVNKTNYVVGINKDPTRQWTYHINMLNSYIASKLLAMAVCSPPLEDQVCQALLNLLGVTKQGGYSNPVGIRTQLFAPQWAQGIEFLGRYQGLFTDKPGKTHLRSEHPSANLPTGSPPRLGKVLRGR